MRFTRYLALALSIFMLCAALAGCTSEKSGEQKTDGLVASGAAPVETVAHVRNAIEAANLLTSADVAIIPGEGVVACSDKADDFLPMYSMYDLKKLSISRSGSTALALTKNNELYFKNMKIAGDVSDVVYATTNMNEEGWYATSAGDVYCMYNDDGDLHSYRIQEGTSPISAIGVEKHDLFIACENGFVSTSGSGEHWEKCAEFMNWGGGIAVIDASKVMSATERGAVDYVTVAAITADGRTLAVGDFAEEILAWGELSYISMNDGVIVGLKPDGTLRLTGPYVQLLEEGGIGALTNIAGIRVSSSMVSAVDTSGNYYFLQYDLDSNYCNSLKSVNISGASNEDTYARIYTGSYVYYSESSAHEWADYDGNARPAGSSVALRGGSTLEYPLTSEAVEAYMDNLFASRKSELDAQQYYWNVFIGDSGNISQLMIRTHLLPNELDWAFMKAIVRDTVASELFGFTPAALGEFDEAEIEYGDSIYLDGWELYFGDSPDGAVFIITSR